MCVGIKALSLATFVYKVGVKYCTENMRVIFFPLHSAFQHRRMKDRSSCAWVISCFHGNSFESECNVCGQDRAKVTPRALDYQLKIIIAWKVRTCSKIEAFQLLSAAVKLRAYGVYFSAKLEWLVLVLISGAQGCEWPLLFQFTVPWAPAGPSIRCRCFH